MSKVEALSGLAAYAVEDDARLRAMIARHHDFLWRSVRRLGVAEAAVDDAMQKLWITVARRLSEIRPDGERAYLFGVAMRVAANARRSIFRAREVPLPDDGERASDARAPDEELARRRARATVDQVLDAMPLELRAVFVLFELEELTVPEVAAVVGVPVGTAASRLRRARERFQQEIARCRAKGALP